MATETLGKVSHSSTWGTIGWFLWSGWRNRVRKEFAQYPSTNSKLPALILRGNTFRKGKESLYQIPVLAHCLGVSCAVSPTSHSDPKTQTHVKDEDMKACRGTWHRSKGAHPAHSWLGLSEKATLHCNLLMLGFLTESLSPQLRYNSFRAGSIFLLYFPSVWSTVLQQGQLRKGIFSVEFQ